MGSFGAVLGLLVSLAVIIAEPMPAQVVWDSSPDSEWGGDLAIDGDRVVASQFFLQDASPFNFIAFWGNAYPGWVDPGKINWWVFAESTNRNDEDIGTRLPGALVASGSAATSRTLESDEGSFQTFRYSFGIAQLGLAANQSFYLALNASSPGSTGAFAWDLGAISHGDTHVAGGTLVDGQPQWERGLLHLTTARHRLEIATVAPEPATIVLLATGLLGLGAAGLRRRRDDS